MSSRDETSKDNNGAEVELTEAELGAVAGGDLTSVATATTTALRMGRRPSSRVRRCPDLIFGRPPSDSPVHLSRGELVD